MSNSLLKCVNARPAPVFLAVLWLVLLVLSPAVIAAEPVIQKQSNPQEKRITKLEYELHLLQQKYEAQQTAYESTTVELRVQGTSLQLLQSEGIKQTQLLKALVENNDPKFTDLLMIAITVVIGCATLWLSFLVYRINKRIVWFTAAMESHSDLTLRIEALRGIKDKPIKLTWWDPSEEPWPLKGQHKKEVELNEIYIGVPVNRRKKHSCRARLTEWWGGVWDRIKDVWACFASFLSKSKPNESVSESTPDNKGS